MAAVTDLPFAALLETARLAPGRQFWSSYDPEADVLYISFRPGAPATDGELTDDDLVVRYDGKEVVGITVLHASKRP